MLWDLLRDLLILTLLDKRRSISGYVFSLCGSAVSWRASLQSVTALSTTEAEYVSSTEGVKRSCLDAMSYF